MNFMKTKLGNQMLGADISLKYDLKLHTTNMTILPNKAGTTDTFLTWK